MDWIAFITNIVNKIPIERVLFPPRDNAKALEEFAKTLPPTKTVIAREIPEKASQAGSSITLQQPKLTTEQTIELFSRYPGSRLAYA